MSSKPAFMAILSVVCLVVVWVLGMPKILIIIAAIVTAILVLNAIFNRAD